MRSRVGSTLLEYVAFRLEHSESLSAERQALRNELSQTKVEELRALAQFLHNSTSDINTPTGNTIQSIRNAELYANKADG